MQQKEKAFTKKIALLAMALLMEKLVLSLI